MGSSTEPNVKFVKPPIANTPVTWFVRQNIDDNLRRPTKWMKYAKIIPA